MSLKQDLFNDLKTAMKDKDTVRKEVIQMVRAGVLQVEKDNKITELDDQGVQSVISKEIKKLKDIPVIMLSARGEEYDKLFGFELGIDDYMVKPFSPKELMARINAILARHNASQQSEETEIIEFGGLVIDIPGRSVTVDGEKIELTPKEYDLLFFLVENKNIALSRDRLLSEIWGYDFFGDDRTIDTHIKNLRNNLGPYRDYIVTLRGVGYKFEYEE